MGINKNYLQKVNSIKIVKDLTFLLIILFVISLPFGNGLNSILLIIIILSLLYELIITKIRGGKFIIGTKKPLVLLIPFVFSLATLSYSSDFQSGLFSLQKNLSFVVFPLIFLLNPSISECRYTKILKVFVLLIFIISIICLFNSVRLIIEHGELIDQAKLLDREYYFYTNTYLSGAIGMNPIYLSMYVNLALFIQIYFFLKEPPSIVRLVAFFIVVVFLFLLSSLINVFVFLILLLYVLTHKRVYEKLSKKQLLYLSSIFLICSVFLAKPVLNRIQNLNYFEYELDQGHIGYWSGVTLRMAIWESSFEKILDKWLIGYGTGSEQNALNDAYHSKNFKIGLLLSYNTHNQWLAFSLRFGVIMTVIVIISILYFPLKMGLFRNFLLTLFLTIIFLNSMTEVIFSTQKGIVFFCFFYCLFLYINDSSSNFESKLIK
ncbi:hypothetical protein C9994_05705 [Marivirga lumbricoides]|uniref:O-antigen ligase-related domain-containing protein n=1 Tax=Marivirga lumbricoides TaxID=1046115 RepID=A0A2T4DSK7_9BACT|nr:hypothetical protein C9994_05705 [Marivirga lumbricoides]